MADLGELKRLSPFPEMETPEAVWLGMKPGEGQMRQGPLTVSALGADPPDRSTHFHVSLLGLQDGVAVQPPERIPPEELSKILDRAKLLNTRTLTFLAGENTDHALVWEALGDLHTVDASQMGGQSIRANLPEGDAEKELRRFIDDSVNLLNELELNEQRIDEGLPPLNLLWPWGHGVRKPVPNLLLKRGEVALVESNSLRLSGLTRLTGYQHGDRHAVGQGTNTRLDRLAEIALGNGLAIIVLEGPGALREKGMQEELHWLIKEVDQRLLAPLFDHALKNPARITVLGTGESDGLALEFASGMNKANPYPFDERSLEEKALTKTDPWIVIEEALRPVGPVQMNPTGN